ncbi:hypothetical protein FBU30_008509 [Linnemannia zychae]|nr:hypothetical protein FBU30_008509 [Linnemannia zychae]
MVALSTLIWTSAKPIIKFVVFAGCGILMAKHGLLSPAGAKVIAALILNYTLPALLFAKMLTCVNQENAEELALVALVAAGIILMGGFLGLVIQRTGLVPKRLHWGIVAATMFTNFGDLPISIILAVSDHPPFLVGDGARGTAYSSVFIAVFYLFLFPFGGYKLIRIDHVKESKRLANLTTSLRDHEANISNRNEPCLTLSSSPVASEATLSNGSGCSSPQNQLQRHQHQFSLHQDNHELLQQNHQQPQHPPHQRHLSSPRQHHIRQDQTGLQSSFSATSTMISMDYNMEENAKELLYRPNDSLQIAQESSSPSMDPTSSPSTVVSPLPLRSVNFPLANPFARMNQDSASQQAANPIIGYNTNRDSNNQNSRQGSPVFVHPPYPLQTLNSSELQYQHQHRYSVESMASNGTGATRFSASHEEDHNSLIPLPASALTKWGSASMGPASRKKSIRPTLFRGGYQPPPMNSQSLQQQSQSSPTTPNMSNSTLGNSISRTGSPSPFISLTPSGTIGDVSSGYKLGRRGSAAAAIGRNDVIETMTDISFEMVALGASQGSSGSSSTITHTLAMTAREGTNTSSGSFTTVIDTSTSQDPAASATAGPLPKVPPQLQKSYDSKKKQQQSETHWFWRYFHSTREYLTPPTIGLIVGLVCALTPLRALFVTTPNPLPSPDELPPLSFILEVTLLLGGCCVPLGLTVLGASLWRLKPGRMRPLIPTLTMVTIAKMVISPLAGILFVQFVLVRHFGWVSVHNHMLQFTLMLMSGSPTSMICFILAQVWDRRTTNAGSEMAAVIAVQYAVGTVLITMESAFMMYFLF